MSTSVMEVPRPERPLVSVVMVTYGRWDWARRALRSLVDNTDPVFETIVVDNASPDDTTDRLREELRGATVVLNDRNAGFGPGANQGALHAVGRFLCFLNSDALVQPGWLPPLLETLERNEDVAAVVPRFVNLDGTLQEAGALVFAGGITLGLGAGEDAEDPEFLFPRTIDYGSAACALFRRGEFTRAGGFHPVYGIGYCEDVDLCFQLSAHGLRTVYEPRSVVAHVGQASTDPDTAWRLAKANTKILARRWPERVADRPSIANMEAMPHRQVVARDASTTERILVIAPRVPRPDDPEDAALAAALEQLASGWPDARITLVAAGDAEGRALAGPFLRLGIEVVCEPTDWGAWFRSRLYHYSVAMAPEALSDQLEGLLARTQPQAVRIDLADVPRSAGVRPSEQSRRDLVRALASAGVAPP